MISKSESGDFVVTADPLALQQRDRLCKFSLTGRVIMAKGDRPWLIGDIKRILSKSWGFHTWKLIPIARVSFTFYFNVRRR